MAHPCLRCGACCASFRIEFYWREANPQDHAQAVPDGLWVDQTQNTRCMKGSTEKHHPKCIALEGRVGNEVKCTIYQNRPSVCRRFQASYEDGKHNSRCDEARTKHGMKPLRREDWYEI